MPNMHRTFGVASLSWIDPGSGLPEVDKGGDPGTNIRRCDVVGLVLYRFANFLEGSVTFDDEHRPSTTASFSRNAERNRSDWM